MKIDKMVDVFLNSANFAQHALLTLAPPSSYILYSKALILGRKTKFQIIFKFMQDPHNI